MITAATPGELHKRKRHNERDLVSEMHSDEICAEIKVIQRDGEKHVKEVMSCMFEEISRHVRKMNGVSTNDFQSNGVAPKYEDKTKSCEDGKLPEKHFLARNSHLTDLFEVKHIRTIYHIFVVVLIIQFMKTATQDLLTTGTLRLGVTYISVGFSGFQSAFGIWCFMLGATLLSYPLFNVWANYRIRHSVTKTVKRQFWDVGWLCALVCYYCVFIYLSAKALVATVPFFAIGSKTAILCEQVRMLMKTHAFVRSNAAHVLKHKPHVEGRDASLPGFSTFLYFLFAPTLVYRHSYPRSKSVRWRIVLLNLLEVLGAVFFYAFIMEHHIVPVFSQYGIQRQTWSDFIMTVFSTMPPAFLMFLCSFYLLLHAWCNAWAEMLRFADRMFYKDWWNSSSFGTYYRTWNVVVHDWLYTYIYKDMYEVVTNSSRAVSAITVFTISAIVHEYIIGFMLGFCYPILFVQFAGVGAALNFLRVKNAQFLGNVFLWWSLIIGFGVQVTLYTIEFYARINCPLVMHNRYFVLDYFVPRSWSC